MENKNYRFSTKVKEEDALRSSFNALTRSTFGLDISGEKKNYLQLGTIMTDEAYCGQGLHLIHSGRGFAVCGKR